VALDNDVTGYHQDAGEDEDGDDENTYDQPDPAPLPFSLMRPPMWLVAHHVPPSNGSDPIVDDPGGHPLV
jgi:hypothetical protein